ncbi:MAG: flavodoxin [Nocardiopsaceae bacterium]|nr:flavodoxin [Nocardiopsaceae bacterium]
MRILVGYASEHGSTREIAVRVAERLREHGHEAEALSLDRAGDVGAYDAAVLGSAVHNSAWLPTAVDYVERNTGALAERPVWLFSIGLAHAMNAWIADRAREPTTIAAFRAALRPRGHRLLAGAVERDHLPFFGRLVFRLMRGRYGDFRNWTEIDAWADSIATDLGSPLR